MNERYKVSQIQRTSLTKNLTSFYQEMSIVNSCGETIIAIDSTGNKHHIAPTNHAAYRNGQSVSLVRREIVGKSKESNGSDVLMDGIIAVVDYFEIKQSPVYVEEFNLLLCTAEDMEDYTHPYQQVTYENGLAAALQEIADHLSDAPSFKLLANDPTNNYDVLFTLINNKVTRIPVTHVKDEAFTLTIVITTNGKLHKEVINLNDFLNGKENTIEFDNRVIPFITTSELNAQELGKSFRWITTSTFNEMVTKQKIKHKEEIDMLNQEHDAKVTELSTKITTLNTTLNQVKSERDDYKYKLEHWQANMEASLEMMKANTERAKYQNNAHISNNDRFISDTKAQSTETEAKLKLWHIAAAAAVPALAIVIAEIIKACKD